MVTQIRTHLTYANVMATIAVFVALGGGAYAAINLPKNSVGTAQIKNKAVTKAKLAKGVAIAGPKGDTGTKGDKGDPGTNGTNGINGKDGTNGKDGANAATTVVMHRVIQGVLMNAPGTATVSCQAGERLISGGGGWVNNISEDLDNMRTVTTLSYNGPASGAVPSGDGVAPAGWTVAGNNTNGFGERLYAYALCASP